MDKFWPTPTDRCDSRHRSAQSVPEKRGIGGVNHGGVRAFFVSFLVAADTGVMAGRDRLELWVTIAAGGGRRGQEVQNCPGTWPGRGWRQAQRKSTAIFQERATWQQLSLNGWSWNMDFCDRDILTVYCIIEGPGRFPGPSMI